MNRAREAVLAWKVADGEAKAAEGRLKAAWDIYDHDKSLPPSAELMVEVSRLRAIANGKLAEAIRLTNPGGKSPK